MEVGERPSWCMPSRSRHLGNCPHTPLLALPQDGTSSPGDCPNFVLCFQVEDLFLTFAKKASAFNSWFENAEEDLTDPVRCNSLEEIKALREAHDAFRSSLSSAQADFNQLAELDRQIKSFRVASNPYTWFTMEALEETWRNLQKIIKVPAHGHLGPPGGRGVVPFIRRYRCLSQAAHPWPVTSTAHHARVLGVCKQPENSELT